MKDACRGDKLRCRLGVATRNAAGVYSRIVGSCGRPQSRMEIPNMAVETPSSKTTSGPVSKLVSTSNMVPIDKPRAKAIASQQAAHLRLVEEDLARLQDQLMDVLEENQRLRSELEARHAGATPMAQQAS